MTKFLLIFLTLSLSISAYARNCRQQLKQGQDKYEMAQESFDKAKEYYDRHENALEKRKFNMAKKYIKLTIDRVNTGLKKFDISKLLLNKTLEDCPRKYKKINTLLWEMEKQTEELTFQLTLFKEIHTRL